MSTVSELIEFNSTEWGRAEIARIDLELLSEFTGLSSDECLERLNAYGPQDMAAAWHEIEPRTPEEIRDFYSRTDLYLWELFGWNGSAVYESYLTRIERLAELWPPDRFPRALDFGCGIGTAALRLAELGFRVTIADVPGRTLGLAMERCARHAYSVDVIEVAHEVPDLPQGSWDVLVCFDVLEHVVDPRGLARQLVRAVTRGGGATIVAAYETQGECWPHHLPSNARELGGQRWEMFLRGLGMEQLGDSCYRRASVTGEALRLLRYKFWRATGIYVEKVPR